MLNFSGKYKIVLYKYMYTDLECWRTLYINIDHTWVKMIVIISIKLFHDSLDFKIEILIHVRQHLYTEMLPDAFSSLL